MQRSEIEGKELLQLPTGELFKAKGPSHENGGIKLNLPAGAKIFSTRLKEAGKTMAERKAAREKRLKKIMNNLFDRPFDPMERAALERTMETNAMQEYGDLMTQEAKNNGDKNFKWGGVKKYADGTGPEGVFPGYSPLAGGVSGMVLDALIKSQPLDRLPTPLEQTRVPELPITPKMAQNDTPVKTNVAKSLSQSVAPTLMDKAKDLFSAGAKTAPLAAGPAGIALGILGPLASTVINRIGDSKNENFYENFGNEGLATNAMSMRTADAGRQSTLRQLDAQRVGSEGLISEGSTSSAAMRASNQLSSANTQGAVAGVNTEAVNTLSGMLAERARLLNEQDRVQMAGAEQAQIRDTQDRDQFFTNLSSNLSNAATGLMYAARNKKKPLSIEDFFKFG